MLTDSETSELVVGSYELDEFDEDELIPCIAKNGEIVIIPYAHKIWCNFNNWLKANNVLKGV